MSEVKQTKETPTRSVQGVERVVMLRKPPEFDQTISGDLITVQHELHKRGYFATTNDIQWACEKYFDEVWAVSWIALLTDEIIDLTTDGVIGHLKEIQFLKDRIQKIEKENLDKLEDNQQYSY